MKEGNKVDIGEYSPRADPGPCFISRLLAQVPSEWNKKIFVDGYDVPESRVGCDYE